MTLLQLENLKKVYKNSSLKSPSLALNNVSLQIFSGECLAVIGESGSGKSTLGKSLLRLIEPDQGRLWHEGVDLFKLPEKRFRQFRSRFQMVFQNPIQALNPRQSVGSAIMEPLRVHGGLSKEQAINRSCELLNVVKLSPDMMNRFPHELSGGQRQRVALARALSTEPIFLVADEPTSSLDASLKRQIISHLQELQRSFNLTVMLISHDLAAVYEAADRIAVMYKGEIVEIGRTRDILVSPYHPYTKTLIQASLNVIPITKEEPSFDNLLSQQAEMKDSDRCQYTAHCPHVEKRCLNEAPALKRISQDHLTACHLSDNVISVHKDRAIAHE